MTWPAVLLWLLILGGLFAPIEFMLYLYFAAATFGGLSLLPPGALGNVPAHTICAGAVIVKTFAHRRSFKALLMLAMDMRKLGLLGIFTLYITVTAFLYPRLFEGSVKLFSLNAAGNLSFLSPTSANITQPIYMLISIGMAFVFAYSARDEAFRRHFLLASLFGAVLLLGSGVIDTVLGDAGREDLLLPFHNATYHLLDTVEVAGQKRVVGFMPEASVFGGACVTMLSFLAFNRQAYDGWLRAWLVPVVALGLFYMAYASTSSGAYIGLGLLAALLVMKFIAEMAFARDFTSAHIRRIIWLAGGLAAGAIVLVLLPRSFYTHLSALMDSVLFQKSSSSSYAERNSWTRAGIAAFWATHGIGVGVGSIRTSNWFVNFAASTGVVGLLLFGGFVVKILLPLGRYPNHAAKRFANGLKLALLPGFAIGSLVGTTPDPGAGMMLTFGLIYALQQKPLAKRIARPVPVGQSLAPVQEEALLF